MRTLSTIILTICVFSLQAQSIQTKPVSSENKREFKNQGEQEDFWAEQLFEKEYTEQVYNKYTGEVTFNNDIFTYGDQTFVIANIPEQLKPIFSTGLFYPSIITGTTTTTPKNKKELDTMTAHQKAIYGWTTTDSLTITNLDEMTSLSKSPTQKRFRFWVYRKGVLNPQVCFIELTNQGATKKTDLETFINGASLTFYKAAWIII